MNKIPENNSRIVFLSPDLFKAAAKYKEKKAQEQNNRPNNNAALTSTLNAMSNANRYGIKELTPEERKNLLAKAYAKQTAKEIAEKYGIDEKDVPTEEIENMVKAYADEFLEEMKKHIKTAIDSCNNRITFDDLKKYEDELEKE